MSSRRTTETTGTQQQSGTTSGDFTGSSQNQFGWQQTPDSQDISALRGYREQLDPSIAHGYARRQTNLRNSYQNPLGQYTTPAMRDAALRSQEGDLEQEYGQAQRVGHNDMQQRTGQRLSGLAGLTAPRLTQTGETSSGTSSGTTSGQGSNSGTTTQSESMLPQIIGAAAGVGGAALAWAILFAPSAVYIFLP